MPEEKSGDSLPPADVQTSLRAIAQLLRQADHLEPEAQQALADLVDEMGNALNTSAIPSQDLNHLAESTAHLAQVVHQQDTGVVSAARQRLEEAIVAVESRAPLAAGVGRRLLETLANLGI
jgi:hypothetical protein